MASKPRERRGERSQRKSKGRAVCRRADKVGMKPTNISAPDYFHKVVDCQWACPAHTPVPEYIRLIAEGRYSDAYMINWRSNVFPGILGRTCDRPCEPACRRVRVEEAPVAICRLKRVAADFKDDVVLSYVRVRQQKLHKVQVNEEILTEPMIWLSAY